jgi:hypothetical protein
MGTYETKSGGTTMKLNEQDLIESLKTIGVEAKLQPNTKQLLAKFSYNDQEYPTFIRQLEGGNLLQLLTFIPCSVDPKALEGLSRLLHMINKELDMPGFCIDEESKTVFYRVVIPCVGQEIDESLFLAYFNTCQSVCATFGMVIHAVAICAMTLNEIIEKMKEKQGSVQE